MKCIALSTCIKCSLAAKRITCTPFVGVIPQLYILCERVTVDDNYKTINTSGTIYLSVGDRVWLAYANITGTDVITIKHMNLSLNLIR